MRVSLRPYRPEDFEVLHAIDQDCYPRDIAYSKWELARYLRLPGADCLIAESNGNGVGYVLSAHEKGRGHVITIDVLAQFRRMGVGSSLLAAAEKRMAERGVTSIVLETAINNQAAISFWRRHGYRTRCVLRNYYPRGIDALAMVKSLKGTSPERKRRP